MTGFEIFDRCGDEIAKWREREGGTSSGRAPVPPECDEGDDDEPIPLAKARRDRYWREIRTVVEDTRKDETL